ncbi:MAG: GH12 family glycosyl hydrolase domain-containing protein [Thermoproteus sp.]
MARWIWAAVVVIIIVAVFAIVATTGQRPSVPNGVTGSRVQTSASASQPQRVEVTLIPNGATPVRAVSRSPAEMMAAYYIGNGSVMITPYPWNMKSWRGEVETVYNGSALIAKINASYSEKYNPYAPVLGYPSARYGCDPLFGACTATEPPLKLPLPATNADAVIEVDYSVQPGNCDVTDFSYDIWFTKGPGLSPGDLELMLWMYYTTPLSQSAPSPYWSPAGSYTASVYVNGARVDMPIKAFLHVDQSSWSVLILAFERPVKSGSVALSIGDLVRIAEKALNGTGINIDRLSLVSIDVGIEFDGPPNKLLSCSYEIYRWALASS